MSDDAAIFERVLPYVRVFTNAIDVGAHRGDWVEKMAPHFETVDCFEPNSVLCDRLSTWASREYENVIVHNVALLDFTGRGTLHCVEGSENKTRSYYVKENADGDVEVRTLDSFRIQGCGLLKIDVEGGELPILRHARRVLRHQKPVVVVECKSRTSNRFGWTLSNLLTYMRELGYYVEFGVDPNLVFIRK